MNKNLKSLGIPLVVALAISVRAAAAPSILMQVNIADPSHVVITAMPNASLITDHAFTNGAGASLLAFFSPAVNFDNTQVLATNLRCAQSSIYAYDFFAPNSIAGALALNLFSDAREVTQDFVSGQTAFTGGAILDLSAYAANLPSVGTIGNIVSGNLNGTSEVLGQYQVIVNDCAIPEVPPEIVSAWKSADGKSLLIFRYDGVYYQVQNSTSRPGMERGSFIWDMVTGIFSATASIDTNGETGLSHLPPATTLGVSGDTLTVSVPSVGSFNFSRVIATSNAIVGSWFFPGEHVTVTFLADGTYFQTEESAGAPTAYDGMEYGTYTWNALTGTLTAVALTDTNGDVGLGNMGSTTATVVGNSLTVNTGGESFTLKRITTSAAPIPNPDNPGFELHKFANYTQSSAAGPSLIEPNSATGTYPYWFESWIETSVGATAPTLKIGSQSPLPFVVDGDGSFKIESDFFSNIPTLNQSFPDGVDYQFSSGTSTATLAFPSSNVFPTVPAIVTGSGAWNAGNYQLDTNGTLSWTGHASFNPAVHVTLLSIYDITLGVDLLDSFAIQGDVTSYDLIGRLVAGHNYWVRVELVKLVATSTSGNGVFADKLGYAMMNSNTTFVMQATSDPVAQPVITQQATLQTHGTGVILSVAATGSPKPSYQWKKNDVAIPGQTGNSLTLFDRNNSDNGDYTVTVTNTAGSETSSVITLSGSQPSDGFSQFVSDRGLDPQTTGAPGFDFDKDGVPNILEYLLNGNPKVIDADIMPTLTTAAVSGGRTMVFRYKRRLEAAGMTQIIEHSASLSPPWIAAVNAQNGVTIVTSPVDALTEQVTVTLPSAGSTHFIRLRVVR